MMIWMVPPRGFCSKEISMMSADYRFASRARGVYSSLDRALPSLASPNITLYSCAMDTAGYRRDWVVTLAFALGAIVMVVSLGSLVLTVWSILSALI